MPERPASEGVLATPTFDELYDCARKLGSLGMMKRTFTMPPTSFARRRWRWGRRSVPPRRTVIGERGSFAWAAWTARARAHSVASGDPVTSRKPLVVKVGSP